MRILLANKYFFIKGGAENSFFHTAKLLENHGHSVSFFSMQDARNLPTEYSRYFVSRVEYDKPNVSQYIKSTGRLLYSLESRQSIERLIQDQKPDLAHLNNIYHQISPSIIHSLRKFKIPIVLSLRDYKVVCASYSMFSEGEVCEACKDNKYFNCFVKGCVKDSKAKSFLNTLEMYLHHKILHIYDLVDVFISPSKFLKNKLEEMGFKKNICHLPNFVNIEVFDPEYEWSENSIVYVGRLSLEKGLFTLLEAMKKLSAITLKIIGEGPLNQELRSQIEHLGLKNVRMLGYMSGEALKDEIRKSMFLVLPSEWYENNPRSVIEAFALGKPVIGARIGGIPELVKDDENGLTFNPGDSKDLSFKIKELLDNPDKIRAMGKKARTFVETELNAEKHYQELIQIYKQAADISHSRK